MTAVLPEEGASIYAEPILSHAPSSTGQEFVNLCFRRRFNGPWGMVPLLRDYPVQSYTPTVLGSGLSSAAQMKMGSVCLLWMGFFLISYRDPKSTWVKATYGRWQWGEIHCSSRKMADAQGSKKSTSAWKGVTFQLQSKDETVTGRARSKHTSNSG